MCGAYNPVVDRRRGLGTKDSCSKTHLDGRASQSNNAESWACYKYLRGLNLMHLASKFLTKIFNVMACKSLQQ